MPALALILSTATAARVGALDPDAEIAIAAVEATGATLTGAQKDAANAFIVTLKGYSIWTKIQALYLFMGGTAAAHAINWKNPGTYDITWYNSPTHSANGVQFGGTAYGDTGVGSVNAESAGHFGYVNSLNTVDTAFPIVAAQSDSFLLDAVLSIGADNLVLSMFGAQSARSGDTMPNRSIGFIFGGRSDGTTLNQRISATPYSYTTSASGSTSPNLNLFIGAYNYEGSAAVHGNGRLAMAGVSDTVLDASELAFFDTAATTLQTALSRA